MVPTDRDIYCEARAVLSNRMRIREWSTGIVKADDGEIVLELPRLGVRVVVAFEPW